MEKENHTEETQSDSLQKPKTKLDYAIESPKDRVKLVKDIINNKNTLTNSYLEILSDYLVFAQTKAEKKERKILTPNRMITIKKREISYQGLTDKFKNGEDGAQNVIRKPDKNILLDPKISITQEDLDTIPDLYLLRNAIDAIVEEGKKATGRRRYALKKQEIEMRQDQYIIKEEYKKPIRNTLITRQDDNKSVSFNEKITLDENQEPVSNGMISLFNYKDVSLLLKNYIKIKEEALDGDFSNDIYYLMKDLDSLINTEIKDNHPMYYDILKNKIIGMPNKKIQEALLSVHNKTYSIEYISRLWRRIIPKIISEKAKENYIVWHFTEVEYGKWKQCSRCKQIKLAHNRFFSKNPSSKDGFYSICKECRNKK